LADLVRRAAITLPVFYALSSSRHHFSLVE